MYTRVTSKSCNVSKLNKFEVNIVLLLSLINLRSNQVNSGEIELHLGRKSLEGITD
jgi:hypothetical protein